MKANHIDHIKRIVKKYEPLYPEIKQLNFDTNELEKLPQEVLLGVRRSFEKLEIRIDCLKDITPLKEYIFELLPTESIYNIIYEYYNKKDQLQFTQKYYQDVMRFIMISLWTDVYRSYLAYNYDLFDRKIMKEYKSDKKTLINSLISNRESLEDQFKQSLIHLFHKKDPNYRNMLTNQITYQASKQLVDKMLITYHQYTEMIVDLLSKDEDEDFFIKQKFDKTHNFLLSREINGKNGIRNICIRYIYLILKICKLEDKRLVYVIAQKLIPNQYKDSLIENDIYKIIKNIDTDKNQNYLETFDGIFEVVVENAEYNTKLYDTEFEKQSENLLRKMTQENSDITIQKYFSIWMEEQLTYEEYKKFIYNQLTNNNKETRILKFKTTLRPANG